jgi:hypothetical protein
MTIVLVGSDVSDVIAERVQAYSRHAGAVNVRPNECEERVMAGSGYELGKFRGV